MVYYPQSVSKKGVIDRGNQTGEFKWGQVLEVSKIIRTYSKLRVTDSVNPSTPRPKGRGFSSGFTLHFDKLSVLSVPKEVAFFTPF